ncbi:MAG TPA: hypothetical protein VIQ51_08240, partial [Chryseosolibacter sp.]
SGVYAAFFHKSRTLSNLSKLFKNGSQLGANDSSASTTLTTQTVTLFAYNTRGGGVFFHSDVEISCFGIGASLTGKEAALNTIFNS